MSNILWIEPRIAGRCIDCDAVVFATEHFYSLPDGGRVCASCIVYRCSSCAGPDAKCVDPSCEHEHCEPICRTCQERFRNRHAQQMADINDAFYNQPPAKTTRKDFMIVIGFCLVMGIVMLAAMVRAQ